jgi:glycosyltransferase involved in cell wall biosynthesis
MLPLVSVKIYAYNHEAYIRQCLEGVLMQQTDFPFEIVLGEHSSSDRTWHIVMDYQKKYPDRMQVIINGRDKSLMQHVISVQQACRGKYQATCEGDDYWIDPLKLQKQVDFLEAHPEVPLCFHNAFVIRQDIFHARYFFSSEMKSLLSFEEAYLLTIPTASIVGRSAILNSMPEWRERIMHTDRLVRLWCAHHGPLGYLPDVMSVYRKHANGMTAQIGQSHQKWYENTVFLCEEFNKATNGQHAAFMSKYLRWAKSYQQRARWGRWYFFLFPHRSKERLKSKLQAMKRT